MIKENILKKINFEKIILIYAILTSIFLFNSSIYFFSQQIIAGNEIKLGLTDKSTYPKLVTRIRTGKQWGELNSPMQVLTNNGKVYISDTGNNRVLVFKMDGEYLYQLEEDVKYEKKRLQSPFGLAIDNQENLYVADNEKGKVLIFDKRGQYIKDFPIEDKYLAKPAGLFIWQDKVYLTDISLNKVYVFNKAGILLFSIGSGKAGSGNEDLYYPYGITVSSAGEIYISDSFNNRIQVYDPNGKYVKTVVGGGQQLVNPRGLAIDSLGNLYVTNTLNNSIKVLDKDGKIKYDMKKKPDFDFYVPVGISIDGSNNIAVADKGANQIFIYKK